MRHQYSRYLDSSNKSPALWVFYVCTVMAQRAITTVYGLNGRQTPLGSQCIHFDLAIAQVCVVLTTLCAGIFMLVEFAVFETIAL